MNTLTTSGQAPAARAVLALLTEFTNLPATGIELREALPSQGVPWAVRVSLHSDLADFEQWREALAILPEDVDQYGSGTLAWLKATADYAGIPIEVIAYYDTDDPAEDPR
ncbi:hypothetical protein [Kitasatospora paranensis]|uniref:Uncharacterized protein n=1 Tax=Kitasatospora paranensis TaxID=258053 RepID=A0ABW2FXZ2_9ACTN